MKSIFIMLFFICSNTYCASVKKSFYDSIYSPQVWGPAVAGLAFALSKYDGEITDYASRENPLFNNNQNAANYSDSITFYYFPAIALISHIGHSMYGNHQGGWLQNSAIIYPTLATYLVNSSIKDRTGRIRPDNSNKESFPSSHTALASSFSDTIYLNSRFIPQKKYRYTLLAVNEVLVMSVAWARMEAKKHHLSDVLVGYSIGKFFSRFFHHYIFGKESNAQISINAIHDHYQVGIRWPF